jgi:hypothetical protein
LKLADAAREIYSGLIDITREGGPGNFMVVSVGEVYVQFAGSPGNPQVQCEAISNEYLPTKFKIKKPAIAKLKEFGFVLGGDEFKNFSRAYDVTTEEQARELSETTVRILEEVYGVAKDDDVQIELSIE